MLLLLWGHIKVQLEKAIEEADISTEVATIKEYEEADNVWQEDGGMFANRIRGRHSAHQAYLESLAE